MTTPPPPRMRIVPETETEKMRSSCLTATVAVLWPRVLAAAPSAGRVSREAVERAIRRSYGQIARTPISDEMWSEHWTWYLRGKGKGQSADYSNVAEAERHALGTIAALGLEMEGDDAAPR